MVFTPGLSFAENFQIEVPVASWVGLREILNRIPAIPLGSVAVPLIRSRAEPVDFGSRPLIFGAATKRSAENRRTR